MRVDEVWMGGMSSGVKTQIIVMSIFFFSSRKPHTKFSLVFWAPGWLLETIPMVGTYNPDGKETPNLN